MINYLKKNKWMIIISALITLVPIIAGVILWDKLPDMVPSHWGVNGEVDDYVSKPMFVFGMPLILVALILVGSIATATDPKNANHGKKPLILVYAIIPALSIILSTFTYCSALGVDVPMLNLCVAVVGTLLIFVGNYLPKCEPSYTIGIRIAWTLNSDKNWVATHRFAGKVWFIGGVVVALSALLPVNVLPWVVFSVFVITALVPVIYSFVYFKNHQSDVDYLEKREENE